MTREPFVSLAIFDLDHTLLAGDSDVEWGKFLVARGLVDGPEYERKNQWFYEEYKAGRLDIYEFLDFALKPLSEHDRATLNAWHREYMEQHIRPMITPAALNLVQQHRQRGDTLMIITATNRFVTEPIAAAFGIEHLLATDPEQRDGRYTGKVAGTPCFQQGKVERLDDWLAEHGQTLKDSWFYSDSHNDLPLLKRVDHPVAVDPDEALKRYASEQGWQILHLHHPS